jgi:hypothetical protein
VGSRYRFTKKPFVEFISWQLSYGRVRDKVKAIKHRRPFTLVWQSQSPKHKPHHSEWSMYQNIAKSLRKSQLILLFIGFSNRTSTITRLRLMFRCSDKKELWSWSEIDLVKLINYGSSGSEASENAFVSGWCINYLTAEFDVTISGNCWLCSPQQSCTAAGEMKPNFPPSIVLSKQSIQANCSRQLPPAQTTQIYG